MTAPVGLIGLGNMGSALAENLVTAGHDLTTFDIAGSARNPKGATFVDDLENLVARVHVLVFSLPDGTISERVARELLDAPDLQVEIVIDTSTTGIEAAQTVDSLLSARGISYIDAPVSGGPAGARARTLTVMYAGDLAACEDAREVLAGLSDRRYYVGARAGMGQALKLANNFLSATALIATSEALSFGTSVGLDMATMLEVINASSGQSAASQDKFVNHVMTARYASGFANTLMSKDVELYVRAARAQGTSIAIGEVTADVWRRFASAEPGADFTRIYPFAKD